MPPGLSRGRWGRALPRHARLDVRRGTTTDPAAIDEFVVYIGGDVPVAEYQPSGSDELAHSVVACLGDRSAALMANHGMVCIGKSVDGALHSALVVEHNAEIMWGSMALGGPVALPRKVIDNFNGIYDFVRNHMWAG